MERSKPEDHLPLHPLEFQILLVLTDGPTHAYALVRAIEERQPSWARIHPTNLYRRIWRLDAARLVEQIEPRDGDDGRKHFALTPLGRKVAHAEARRLRDLLEEAARAGVSPEAAPGGSR